MSSPHSLHPPDSVLFSKYWALIDANRHSTLKEEKEKGQIQTTGSRELYTACCKFSCHPPPFSGKENISFEYLLSASTKIHNETMYNVLPYTVTEK